MKNNKIIIVLLTALTWHKILWQTFMGEGYYYFNHTFFYDPQGGFTIIQGLLRYDTAARLMFDFLPLFFKDRVWLYFLFLFLVVILVNWLFYRFIWQLTKNRLISILSIIFFVANYSASYEMLARGDYQFFAQRIILFPLLFLSFIWLTKKHLWLSVSLYTVALILGQFSLYFLAVFPLYIFFQWLQSKQHSFLQLLQTLPYLVITALMFLIDNQTYNQNFEMVWNPESIVSNVVYQFPWAMIPYPLLIKITKQPWVRADLVKLAWPLAGFTLLAIIYFFKRQLKYRYTLLIMVLFLITSLGLNAYIRPTQVFRIHGEGSRYLYVPAMAAAGFWAILFESVFEKRWLAKTLVVLIAGWWLWSNTSLIWSKMAENQPQHETAKQILAYFKIHAPEFDNKLVVVPNLIGYHGGDFSQKFYNPSTTFLPMAAEWEKKITYTFPPEKLLVFTYDAATKTLIESGAPFRQMILDEQTITEEVKQSF